MCGSVGVSGGGRCVCVVEGGVGVSGGGWCVGEWWRVVWVCVECAILQPILTTFVCTYGQYYFQIELIHKQLRGYLITKQPLITWSHTENLPSYT